MFCITTNQFHLYPLCLPLEKRGRTNYQSFTYLKGLELCYELLPPYFLGRVGEGTNSNIFFLSFLKALIKRHWTINLEMDNLS
jgi:hypothetical protein